MGLTVVYPNDYSETMIRFPVDSDVELVRAEKERLMESGMYLDVVIELWSENDKIFTHVGELFI
jgi:hypothetical protein